MSVFTLSIKNNFAGRAVLDGQVFSLNALKTRIHCLLSLTVALSSVIVWLWWWWWCDCDCWWWCLSLAPQGLCLAGLCSHCVVSRCGFLFIYAASYHYTSCICEFMFFIKYREALLEHCEWGVKCRVTALWLWHRGHQKLWKSIQAVRPSILSCRLARLAGSCPLWLKHWRWWFWVLRMAGTSRT